MKKLLLLITMLVVWAFNVFAQTTLTLQPDSTTGVDADISLLTQLGFDTINGGNNTAFFAWAWTGQGYIYNRRGLIYFDLTSIPANAIVTSAYLTLYSYPGFPHSQLSGANDAYLQKVTSPWNVNTVTWNTQPPTTAVNEAYLPPSTSDTERYTIDVRAMMQDFVTNPSQNYGMMLRLVTESHYRALDFASSNYPDTTRHPKLVITYTTGCTNLVLQPDSAHGVDADLSLCTPFGFDTVNGGSNGAFFAWAWTKSGYTYNRHGLIYFDLTSIPTNATVNSAYLTLHSYPGFPHSQLSGANDAYLQKVTNPWNVNAVTWNTQPPTTTVNEAYLPPSTSDTEIYIVDVKAMIQDFVTNPAQNYGMMLRLVTESYYRALDFASSNYPDSYRHPKLEICYTAVSVVAPVALFQASDSIICENSCINITDLSSNATSWQWSFAGGTPSSSTNENPQQICYPASGNYGISLIASNAAGSDTISFSNYISVHPSPPPPLITRSNDTLFCSTDSSYISYQWYYESGLIPGATKTFLVISFDGNYNVKVSNSNNCATATGINTVIGLQNYNNDNVISLYPNPVANQLTIHTSSFHNEAVTVSIFNTLGEILKEDKLRWSNDLNVNIKNFPAGIYFLEMKTENGRVVKKFVKQ